MKRLLFLLLITFHVDAIPLRGNLVIIDNEGDKTASCELRYFEEYKNVNFTSIGLVCPEFNFSSKGTPDSNVALNVNGHESSCNSHTFVMVPETFYLTIDCSFDFLSHLIKLQELDDDNQHIIDYFRDDYE